VTGRRTVSARDRVRVHVCDRVNAGSLRRHRNKEDVVDDAKVCRMHTACVLC
jgi:hypothetical protein